MKRKSINIPEELHTKLKVIASKEKTTIKELLIKIIEKEL